MRDAIRTNFADIVAAWDYFLSMKAGGASSAAFSVGREALTFSDFTKAVNALIPKRFTQVEVMSLWERLVGTDQTSGLTFPIFREHFESERFIGSFRANPSISSRTNRTRSRRTGRPATASLTISGTSMGSTSSWQDNIIEKIRNIIRASPLSI
jgi:hypothetical protein